jgi:uncharacterized protein YeaO (DUF488 family)
MAFQTKRAYEPASAADGTRVLVDRLWPRGLKKADAQLALWLKDIAPSPKLRIWFGHEPARFAEFARRYRAELAKNPAVVELRKLGKGKLVTLLYAARDPEVNHAVVLKSYLSKARSTVSKKSPARAN